MDDAGNVQNSIQLDKPHCVLGRAADSVDFPLTHEGASREHAALVHHEDGRIYVIDLQSVCASLLYLEPTSLAHTDRWDDLPFHVPQTRGTLLNGKPMHAHKPTALFHGSTLQFGGGTGPVFKLHAPHLGARVVIKSRKAITASSTARQEVRASHLLVKHRDVRRPSSWKEKEITRSKVCVLLGPCAYHTYSINHHCTQEEALAMIEEFRRQLVAGADFATLASTESHCSSAQRGGDLGVFGKGQMQPAFEQAAFALQVGELSQPVFSDSGVHLILRTA